MTRIKVNLIVRFGEDVQTFQRIMSIDVPSKGDYVFLFKSENTEFAEVTKVFHRDEHYPIVMLKDLDVSMAYPNYLGEMVAQLKESDWEIIR